jgi:CMP/dCMP kinase
MPEKKLVIAIDGHSSCGKSTFAKAIAAELNIRYIDSGAMYRAVTLACLDRGLVRGSQTNEKEMEEVLRDISIEFRRKDDSCGTETYLNGINVEQRIRSLEVASMVSDVSKSGKVREKMVAMQREMGKNKGIVMDGRDIGTIVFPQAEIKIFMTADPEIRAERRFKELKGKGMDVSLGKVLENIIERDTLDQTRRESPLYMAPDAILLDNTHMTPARQMIWFRKLLADRKFLNYPGNENNN